MKRCPWPGCNGAMIEHETGWRCLYCGRNDNLKHEKSVRLMQKVHGLSGNNVSVYTTHVPTFNRDYPKNRRGPRGPRLKKWEPR